MLNCNLPLVWLGLKLDSAHGSILLRLFVDVFLFNCNAISIGMVNIGVADNIGLVHRRETGASFRNKQDETKQVYLRTNANGSRTK